MVYGFSLSWLIEQHRKHNLCLCIQILSLSYSPASSKPMLWTPDTTVEEQGEGEGRGWYTSWKCSLPSRQKPNDTITEQLSHEHILFGSFWESRVEAGAARGRNINANTKICSLLRYLIAVWHWQQPGRLANSCILWKKFALKANGDPREITHYSLSL